MKFDERADRLLITEGARLVAGYIYRGTWRPYFYPLNGPFGNVVRGIDGSEHHNQYGLSLAYGGHGEGGSTNIWSDYDEPPYGPCGKILHDGFRHAEILTPPPAPPRGGEGSALPPATGGPRGVATFAVQH